MHGGLLIIMYTGQSSTSATLGALPPPAAITSVPVVATTTAGAGAGSVWAPPPLLPPLTSTVWSLPPSSFGAGLPPAMQTLVTSPPLPTATGAFSLSPATEPFPQKLVAKILSGQFVDMREMLTDNISLLQQLEIMGGQTAPGLPGVLRPRLREVNTLATWIYCFLAYVAIRSPDPHVRDWLAYARLVVREAQRHGGNGFLDYDRVFRQQAALDQTIQWNCLHPGIQAATLVGRPSGVSTFCTFCREPDHASDRCALAYSRRQIKVPVPYS